MDLEQLRTLLGWNIVIHMGVLMWWAAFIVLAGDWVYRMHNRWLPISREHFNTVHYAGIACYKIAIFVLFLVPWITLYIV